MLIIKIPNQKIIGTNLIGKAYLFVNDFTKKLIYTFSKPK